MKKHQAKACKGEQQAGDALEGFEVLPRHCLDAVVAYLPDTRSPLENEHAWYALIELVAPACATDGLDTLVETVFETAMERELLEDAVIAANESQAESFWHLRESISPAERAIGPAMQHDISVPVSRMAEFVETVSPQIETRFPGTLVAGFGHLGDGNIHYHVLAPEAREARQPRQDLAGQRHDVPVIVGDGLFDQLDDLGMLHPLHLACQPNSHQVARQPTGHEYNLPALETADAVAPGAEGVNQDVVHGPEIFS